MELVLLVFLILFFSIAIVLLTEKQAAVSITTTSHNIKTIEKLFPQTQCGACGFNGCRPYAEAIARHQADINRCLPGGMDTVSLLAQTLGIKTKPLYKENKEYENPAIALIDEEHCIGCVKCIVACPVDAIIGAPKQMHSVINNYCTGCKLCVAPCPVDCISMTSRQ